MLMSDGFFPTYEKAIKRYSICVAQSVVRIRAGQTPADPGQWIPKSYGSRAVVYH